MNMNALRISLAAAYLDYVNNFLTIGGYADYHHITDAEAEAIINAGRIVHETSVAYVTSAD